MGEEKGNRDSTRAPVVPTEIRGLITSANDEQQQQPFLIWDVSKAGLGIWIADEIPCQTQVTVTIGQPYLLVLHGRVKWCESCEDDAGYRVGIEIQDDLNKLVGLYQAFSQSDRSDHKVSKV